ncbi:MAG: ComF family protein [Candidatus Krumholzibacteriota bacterium]|nr:ComF family protein [Candidatus Krumholzibacteriota bacterium]
MVGRYSSVPSVFPENWSVESPAFFHEDLDIDCRGRFPASLLCHECWLRLIPSAGISFPARWGGVPAVTPFMTNDTLLKVIRFLKFDRGKSAVVPLAWWIASAIARFGSCISASPPVIVPVPLHADRRSERGFNQAELLAAEVARILGTVEKNDLLYRKKKTRPQSKLDAGARILNVSGAFVATNEAFISGRDIILIDDLVTTGETVKECIKALQKVSLSPIMVAAAGRSATDDDPPVAGEKSSPRPV